MDLFFRFRVALYTAVLLFVSFIAVIEGVILTLIGKRLNTNYYVARTFYYIAGPIMGWKFKVEGEEHLWNLGIGEGGVQGEATKNGRSAVMLGNHQSFVDILWLGRIFPQRAAIMAKKSIKWIPGLGWFMLLSGTVFINRGNNKSAVASMSQAGEDMKRKRISLWIFPEGTRHLSAQTDLLPFKKGAFYLAVQSGIPIVPVAIQNYHHLFDGKTRFKSGTLRIKVLPPIPTTGLTTSDVPSLMEKTRNIMLKTLRELDAGSDKPLDPTSLLNAENRPSYDAISDSAPLEGAVAGASSDSASALSQSSTGEEDPTTPILTKASQNSTKGTPRRKGKKPIA